MKTYLKSAIFTFLILTINTFTVSGTQLLDEINDPMYPGAWNKIDSLEQKGLFRMALKEVDKVFNYAASNSHHNQVIKAVIYELKYNSYLEEDDYVLGIYRLESLIETAPSPSKEILHSLLAEVYWGYYSANSWKFQDRTNVAEVDLQDVRTWDLKRIALKIRHHYTLSLLNETISQAAPLSKFNEIITSGSYDEGIRPTLFDFLGHRALSFFRTNVFALAGPAETFTLDQEAYFGPTTNFLQLNVATTDSLNTRFLAVKVLRSLTHFHFQEKNQKALFYLELERLKFVRDKSTLPDAEERFYAALNRMTGANQTKDYVSEAWFELATYHANKGASYDPFGDTTAKDERKKAHAICQRTIEKFPNAYGSKHCAVLMRSLENKEIQLNIEDAIVPNTKARYLLSYRNIEKVHVKLVELDYEKYLNSDKYSGDKLYKHIRKSKAVYSGEIDLTNPSDYNLHRTELDLPKLKSGMYYLAVSTDGKFNENKGGYAAIPVLVNDITYQQRKLQNEHEVMVSRRSSGDPLVGASVTVYYSTYNYRLRRYENKTIGTYKTNELGRIKFKMKEGYRDYHIKIKYGSELYVPQVGIYRYGYHNQEDDHNMTHFFTDRKIYRPGQKIYFKGIVTNYRGKERKLLKNQATTVYFYDVNGQEVARKDVVTNQFGSYEGEFTAPFGVLTGQMRIADNYGSTYFRVEEYKRPKFNIEMLPVKGEFELNDSIDVKALAKAFAGNPIDGAAVKYRVVRSTQFNWRYWWGWRPQVEPKEIAQGNLMTDEKGELTVRFKALPDKEMKPEHLPIFTYTVYVDVTDINGETHSASTSVRVGYQSLVLGHNLSADMDNSNPFVLNLTAQNLNGQPIDAKGEIKVAQLKVPNQAYYSRFWARPDMNQWSEEEFRNLFPTAEFGAENNPENWKVEQIVFATSFDTKDTTALDLENFTDWRPGIYRYESVATDKNGVEVKDVHFFTVFNPAGKQTPNNEVLWLKSMDTQAEPGDKVTFLLGTIESDLTVAYDTEANGKLIDSKIITLNKEQRKLEFEIEEAYRGNFTVHFSAIKNNRHFGQSFTVVVPYTNKALDVQFSTFRNKLLPGADEEWTLTVKNKAGGKEAAEFLATLYDASLDQLYTPNSFYMNIYKTYYGANGWNGPLGMNQHSASNINYYWNRGISAPQRHFPRLNYFGWSSYYYGSYGFYGRYDQLETVAVASMQKSSGNIRKKFSKKGERSTAVADSEELSDFALEDEMNGEGFGTGAGGVGLDSTKELEQDKDNRTNEAPQEQNNSNLGEVKARTNFNETAFFYPQLTTNAKGEIQIKFTIPESLTKWRFLGLAHTKDLKVGTISEEVVTQKELMVVPNVPRFLREGDELIISTKISNISDKDLQGGAQLSLYDPFTEKSIDHLFELEDAERAFTAEKGRSTTVSWKLKVPYMQSAVKYKIVAKAGTFSDGEENVLPILSNRMLVTESLPLPIRGNETKNFKFDKLLKSNSSKTLRHHNYTLEFTSNPAWYAIQAMPYMMEYPHECAEQVFTRYYSNAIASHIMNSNPKIKKIVEDWGENSPEAFLSNLQKNQELKAVMLEETPWVLAAKNEAESKRNLAVLLDMERMSRELDKALGKTIKSQSSNGGWPWFPGMRESRYITQHIVTGMGHLDHLGIKEVREDRKVWRMVEKAVGYLDGEIVRDFQLAKKYDDDYLTNQHIGYTQIQYLYARTYFPRIGMNGKTKEAVNYYKDQAVKFWLKFNIYAEGMIALSAHRFAELDAKDATMKTLASDIVKSLKDRSIQHEEFGMYWKDYQVGYYWYQAPIETQALMIEMFDEVANDQASVEELKIWLLKQKQTTNWKTTKQTTEAVYALLLKGTDLLASDDLVSITVGGQEIEYVEEANDDPYKVNAQAGTGYFKTAWNGEAVKPKMGEITVSKKSDGVAWGAAYWQYFEDLDKITFAETNLKLKKDLFLVELTSSGEQLKPINESNVLKVGEKIRVRIELRTDRNLEYVHMKDMRASGFEPIDVLSSYRYQDGLGYYQSTKDAATHFFFDYVRKGTYVFEYDLRVQHTGDFSNGITSIQCMYAPEFTAHSEGIRVRVQ